MPESFIRRALSRALFDRRGIRQILYGAGTTLDVDIVAFEEVRLPAHIGRVELRCVVVGDRTVRFSRSIRVERAIANASGDASAEAIVQALSTALADAIDILADSTAAELRVEASTRPSDAASATR